VLSSAVPVGDGYQSSTLTDSGGAGSWVEPRQLTNAPSGHGVQTPKDHAVWVWGRGRYPWVQGRYRSGFPVRVRSEWRLTPRHGKTGAGVWC